MKTNIIANFFRKFRLGGASSRRETLIDFRENLLTPHNPQHAGEMPVEALDSIQDICRQVNPSSILELGFNRGSSAVMWLLSSKAQLVSVDLLSEAQTIVSRQAINKRFPGRFTYYCADHGHLHNNERPYFKGYISLALLEKFRCRHSGQLKSFPVRKDWMKGTPWWPNPASPQLITPLPGDPIPKTDFWLKERHGSFDLAFIDGEHSEPAVTRDIKTVLSHKIPYIVFDDFSLESFDLPSIIKKFNLEILQVYPTGNGQVLTKVLPEDS